MEPDRKGITEEIAGTGDRLIADLDHLRKLWTGLQQTEEVLLRATAAYHASQKLLLEMDAERGIGGSVLRITTDD